MFSPRIGILWVLAGVSAVQLTVGCSSDEDTGGGPATPADTGFDAGTVLQDSGPTDSGPAPDLGFTNRPDAGHYCAANDEVVVDGVQVPVDPATARATGATGAGSFSCIDSPPGQPPFIENFCTTLCLDFFGYAPTAAEVEGLEFHAFLVTLNGEAVDPSFDYATYQDRQPAARLPIGARTVEVSTNDCPSGWQLEMGYLSLGADTFNTETLYTIRVRSSSTSRAFPTTYLYRHIRRNDQSPNPDACRVDEVREPRRDLTFPVVPPDFVAAGVQAASSPIPGSANLNDGLGTGYALVEVRDCAAGSGVRVVDATAGTLPGPTASFYPGDDLMLGADRATSARGLFYGVGFPGLTATSSDSVNVTVGVGILRNEDTCTEEWAGFQMPIFADGVTFVRANRETVVHGR